MCLGALVAVAASCSSGSSTSSSATPSIVVTYSALGDVVQHLVGDTAQVVVIIPNGQDQHDFSPSAKDIELMNSASLVVSNGLDLEEGLEDAFKSGLEKAKDLKESFKSFLSSINVTVSSFLDTVAYSFLIPIILDIQTVASGSTDLKESSIMIAERLIASGVVVVTAKVLASVIKKILERIK
jgi:ABC-type Zn uptake system ZnuABC Zn-binding protein ZnuA